MRYAFRIANKDLKLRLRDRSAIIIGIVAPLSLSAIFYFVFGSAFEPSGGFGLEYGIVDLDESALSTPLVEILEREEEEGILEVERYPDAAAADAAVGQDIDAYLLIEDGFCREIVGGGSPTIRVIGDVDAQTSTQIAAAIAGQYVTGIEIGRAHV